jgi:hypothetical protein
VHHVVTRIGEERVERYEDGDNNVFRRFVAHRGPTDARSTRRPAQTVYEYAGVLSDVLPTVRPELETVAQAKVESVYAREILGDERIQSLKAAQRRLRVSLLRLAFRR